MEDDGVESEMKAENLRERESTNSKRDSLFPVFVLRKRLGVHRISAARLAP